MKNPATCILFAHNGATIFGRIATIGHPGSPGRVTNEFTRNFETPEMAQRAIQNFIDILTESEP